MKEHLKLATNPLHLNLDVSLKSLMPSRDLSWLHEAPNGNPFVLLPSRANVAFQNVAVKTKEDTIFQRRSMTRHFRTDSTSLVNGWSGSLSVHLHEIPRLQRCLPCNASCHGGLLFKKKNTRPEQYPFYGRVRQQQQNWKKNEQLVVVVAKKQNENGASFAHSFA